ncbi:hypothetical protein AG1IA_07759 [Rhizoctonia solani AG-1 IA]|uniref:Uncharacterized protein n=1 Tax=Thanatephorus cucumeris (strain AG1-IA) TaxID=983506 RepID=L8WJ24_THACA|nr:hypothetical protein AG1IA_07759 [Rhizoctonia solani AG-1 IA]
MMRDHLGLPMYPMAAKAIRGPPGRCRERMGGARQSVSQHTRKLGCEGGIKDRRVR